MAGEGFARAGLKIIEASVTLRLWNIAYMSCVPVTGSTTGRPAGLGIDYHHTVGR